VQHLAISSSFVNGATPIPCRFTCNTKDLSPSLEAVGGALDRAKFCFALRRP
jgi:hypothetical protein